MNFIKLLIKTHVFQVQANHLILCYTICKCGKLQKKHKNNTQPHDHPIFFMRLIQDVPHDSLFFHTFVIELKLILDRFRLNWTYLLVICKWWRGSFLRHLFFTYDNCSSIQSKPGIWGFLQKEKQLPNISIQSHVTIKPQIL